MPGPLHASHWLAISVATARFTGAEIHGGAKKSRNSATPSPAVRRLPATRRRQPAIDDPVEQCLVAHLEDAGLRGSIPAHPMQHVLAWMALATRSFPTPFSPRINTVASVSATFSMIVPMARICELPSESDACLVGSDVCTDRTSTPWRSGWYRVCRSEDPKAPPATARVSARRCPVTVVRLKTPHRAPWRGRPFRLRGRP